MQLEILLLAGLFMQNVDLCSPGLPEFNRTLRDEPPMVFSSPRPPRKLPPMFFSHKRLFPMQLLSDIDNGLIQSAGVQWIYQYHAAKNLKKRNCHACGEIPPSDCTIFKKYKSCQAPKIEYYREQYCLYAKFICHRAEPVIVGRKFDKIVFNGTYLNPALEEEMYPDVEIYHPKHEIATSAPFFFEGIVNCLSDKRWYYKVNTGSAQIAFHVYGLFCL